jgi:hypothetical protein
MIETQEFAPYQAEYPKEDPDWATLQAKAGFFDDGDSSEAHQFFRRGRVTMLRRYEEYQPYVFGMVRVRQSGWVDIFFQRKDGGFAFDTHPPENVHSVRWLVTG